MLVSCAQLRYALNPCGIIMSDTSGHNNARAGFITGGSVTKLQKICERRDRLFQLLQYVLVSKKGGK